MRRPNGMWRSPLGLPSPSPRLPDLESLSVRALKDILQSRNVGVEDCVEKRDLIDKIKRVFILP